MNAYYTYFDRNYAVRAVAMYRSLRRNSGPMHMFMICLDEESRAALAHTALPDVTLLDVGDLDRADPELYATRKNRSLVEYYFTCTSSAGWFLMHTRPEIKVLTYVDSDLFFFSPVDPLFQEFRDHSVGAMYHRFPEYGMLRQGRYNVGWVSWRRDQRGMACLETYRRQCLDWCYLQEEDGRYADQLYLDRWEHLPGFHAFRHRGANAAPWNLGSYKLSYAENGIQVDGYPLVFFHFHRFKALGHNWFDSHMWKTRRMNRQLRERLISPYVDELRRTGLDLPLTGSRLRVFPNRNGAGLLARNTVRVGLSLLRGSYVYYPGLKGCPRRGE